MCVRAAVRSRSTADEREFSPNKTFLDSLIPVLKQLSAPHLPGPSVASLQYVPCFQAWALYGVYDAGRGLGGSFHHRLLLHRLGTRAACELRRTGEGGGGLRGVCELGM